ncbi:MAG: hypothetical protein UW41_C0005G0047 [Candidatus Collierbacteria bacterium GW2011_GWC2_44_18]|uniref:DUF5615 domain-containing protein n=2 Tax=Microgenomates group TaxID=1794810 RepID=A0A0G1LGD9_9BACT|nr:MAG: hypothetical protein UW41_C0005G0047 [Candidatus Collierbacteria bacterium GW2011_GWC2_44_18]KKT67782.1 MAG: hypothetical protein UW60_C0001G0060 [Candidatus Woesebacteria bacterium GW2011_GWA2_44_33]
MSPHQDRFKLLLDEMLPKRDKFPILNKLHNLKHIVHDVKGSGLKDEDVVLLAKKQKRILISKNDKHMIDLCNINKVQLICITETMREEEIDKKIVAMLSRRLPNKSIFKISHSPRK